MDSKKSPLSDSERIKKLKKVLLQIIEALLEEEIPEEWFLENCVKLCQSDYDDVVQERSIGYICGYPLCSKPIQKVIKQKFKICKAENKVYDLTERKNFCSNNCYSASNFLKAQLHSLPLYMRKSENSGKIKLKLLSPSDNKGSAGEELLFKHSISKEEVELPVVKPIVVTNLNNMLQEDIKDCTEHLSGLKIKENTYKEKYVFGKGNENSNQLPENSDEDVLSDSEASDTSEEDKSLFRDYDDTDVFSNKHMPVPEKTNKSVLIAPLKATQPTAVASTDLHIDSIGNIFEDWFTEDTMKYLLGERQVYSIKADHLWKTMVHSDDSPEKLSTIKREYVDLCIKLDRLPEEELEVSDDSERAIFTQTRAVSSDTKQSKLEKLAEEVDSKLESKMTNVRRKTKRRSQGKGKSVSFANSTKTLKDKFKPGDLLEETESSLSEPTLPLVDSLSQNTLRKQVLLGKIKNVFVNMLSVIDLHYRDIKEEVKGLVDTFSLTPTNIVHKPKQLKCIAAVIFRLLTKTKLKELHQEPEFSKLCEAALTSLNISQESVEALVCDLVSANQVLKLYKIVAN